MSISSMKALHLDMKKKFGFKYILTHRTNQDCLENFFSQMRLKNRTNDHPTPIECLNNTKLIMLGKNPGLSKHLHSNTIERDPEEYVSATFSEMLSQDSCNVDFEYLEDKSDGESDADLPHSCNNELDEQDDTFWEAYSNVITEPSLNYEYSDCDQLEVEEKAWCDEVGHPNDFTVELKNSTYMPGQCIHLSIECLEEYPKNTSEPVSVEFLTNDPKENEYFTDEFLNDLTTTMKYDEEAARTRRSTEDGLGKISLN